MQIIERQGIAFSVIQDKMNYPFLREFEEDDMLCEDVSKFYSDPNCRSIVLIRDNSSKPIMTINDVIDELEYLSDETIRWKSEERRKGLTDYYTKIHSILKTYKREEQINKVLNSNECLLWLAC
jgi:hypothetical protein